MASNLPSGRDFRHFVGPAAVPIRGAPSGRSSVVYAVRRDRTDLRTDQAGRRRAAADRRDHQPHRAQRPHHRSAGAPARRREELASQHYAEHDGKPFFGRCWSSSRPDRWWPRSSRDRERSRRFGSSPVVPTRSRRPRPGRSAVISGWRRSSTWCTGRIRPNRRSARSRCGFPTSSPVGIARQPVRVCWSAKLTCWMTRLSDVGY